MEENQMFKVKDENGMEKNAELLSAFDMDDKNYIIYSIDNGEEINDTALDMGAFNSNTNLVDLITAGAPILQSSAGGLGYINDAPSIQTILNEPDNNNGLYQGDYMYLYLKAGSQYIGACVEYFDIVAS